MIRIANVDLKLQMLDQLISKSSLLKMRALKKIDRSFKSELMRRMRPIFQKLETIKKEMPLRNNNKVWEIKKLLS